MKSYTLKTIFPLVLISVGYFATDIYLPSLPQLAVYFQVNEGEVQMTIFSYLISFSCTPLIFGPLSDYIGRKRVILLGLATALLATVGCYFSTTIHMLTAFRFLQGMGTGANMIASRAMVTDFFEGKTLAKQLSYMTLFLPLVLSIAPTLGGILQESYGWHAVFLFLIYYLTLILFWVSFSEESLQKFSTEPWSKIFAGYSEVIRNRSFLLFGFGIVPPTIGLFAYFTASPFLLQKIVGLSPAEYGFLALYTGAAIMASSYFNAKLLNIIPLNTLLWVGTGFILAAGALMYIFHALGIINTWSVLLPAMLYFCCMPLTLANSVGKAMTKIKRNFGAANGILTTGQFLAGALGSLFFSYIPATNVLPLALCFLVVGLWFALNLFIACKNEEGQKKVEAI